MKRLSGLVAVALCASSVLAAHAHAACQIKSFVELPVTVANNRFLIEAGLDGKPVTLMVDSGASGTTLFNQAADEIGLGFKHQGDAVVTGINGTAQAEFRRVGVLQLGRFTRTNPPQIIVAASKIDNMAAGLLGRDEYGGFDLEFDIPHRMIRFLRAEGCSDGQMPYWATKAYSESALILLPGSSEYRTTLLLNGRPVPVTVDSGTPITTVSISAANTAGLYQRDFHASGAMGGMGSYRLNRYTATFKTVTLDGETVQNVELPVAPLFRYSMVQRLGTSVPMESTQFAQGLLGADFLMSHRVLLSRSHQMMYFTYEGGNVFGPDAGPKPIEAKADAPPSAPSPP